MRNSLLVILLFIVTGWVIITESGIDTMVFISHFFFFQPMSIFLPFQVVTQLAIVITSHRKKFFFLPFWLFFCSQFLIIQFESYQWYSFLYKVCPSVTLSPDIKFQTDSTLLCAFTDIFSYRLCFVVNWELILKAYNGITMIIKITLYCEITEFDCHPSIHLSMFPQSPNHSYNQLLLSLINICIYL